VALALFDADAVRLMPARTLSGGFQSRLQVFLSCTNRRTVHRLRPRCEEPDLSTPVTVLRSWQSRSRQDKDGFEDGSPDAPSNC
jgi:hypothetical protein